MEFHGINLCTNIFEEGPEICKLQESEYPAGHSHHDELDEQTYSNLNQPTPVLSQCSIQVTTGQSRIMNPKAPLRISNSDTVTPTVQNISAESSFNNSFDNMSLMSVQIQPPLFNDTLQQYGNIVENSSALMKSTSTNLTTTVSEMSESTLPSLPEVPCLPPLPGVPTHTPLHKAYRTSAMRF